MLQGTCGGSTRPVGELGGQLQEFVRQSRVRTIINILESGLLTTDSCTQSFAQVRSFILARPFMSFRPLLCGFLFRELLLWSLFVSFCGSVFATPSSSLPQVCGSHASVDRDSHAWPVLCVESLAPWELVSPEETQPLCCRLGNRGRLDGASWLRVRADGIALGVRPSSLVVLGIRLQI